jgi:high-affinity iron transporter
MLPTLVIGLREGLEAALIVGIVAAFLRQRGRLDLLRWVFAGIAAALTLCIAAGVALEIVSRELPQRQQEGLETVIGVFAVAMVSYMVVWMRRHSRDLKGQLEGAAGAALAEGSAWALVAMAFLAVLREGLETVVFLLAAFNESGSGQSAWVGAVVGILISVGLGWGIYRGGIRLNLSKFFRATGAVLVLVAAGLVVSALHTAHEAGWLNAGQQRTLDLTSIVRPGSIQSSILTGMLGLQPRPVLIELIGWLVYLVPMILYVSWAPGKGLKPAAAAKLSLSLASACLVGALTFVVLLPGSPADKPVTRSGDLSAQVLSQSAKTATIRASLPSGTSLAGVSTADLKQPRPVLASTLTTMTANLTGTQEQNGIEVQTYTASHSATVAGAPTALTYADLAALNGGRLPLGVRTATSGSNSVPAQYLGSDLVTFTVAASTGRVLDVRWGQTLTVQAKSAIATIPIQAGTTTKQFDAATTTSAVSAARADEHTISRRHLFVTLATLAAVAGLVLLLAGAAFASKNQRNRDSGITVPKRSPQPLAS